MKRIAAWVLALTIAVGAWCAPAEGPATGSEIREILDGLAAITGLKPLKPVRSETMDKDELKRYIEQRMREVVKPEELRAEELTLKKFGFVPPDFDLKRNTVDLLTEQAAAFYDFRKKRLFLVTADTGGMARHAALAHELAHALADQHFNLEKFIKRGRSSDESSLARLAVMEGQASWLMSEYVLRQAGRSLKDSPGAVEAMSGGDAGAGQFPVLEKTPLYLRETLLFPYTKGMLFQHRVYERMGMAAFAEVFRRPPATTQQVLHPEKYFDRVAASHPGLPAVPDRGQYRRLTDGEVGELDHAILLRQYIGERESRSLAPEWKGGAYELLEHKKDRRVVLSYAVEFRSPESAREYFGFYRRVLKAKWKSMDERERTEDSVSGSGDDGEFVLRLEAARVSSVEGLLKPGARVR